MSEFCYVILAHTDGPGLERLIARLRALSPKAEIVVRFEDAGLLPAERIAAHGARSLISDIPARWGSWTLVEAVAEALQHAVTHTDAQWFSLISGQDYPIRPLAEWEELVAGGGAEAYLAPMHADPQTWEYRWSSFTMPSLGLPVAQRALNAALDRVGRRLGPALDVYRLERTGPSHWWVRRRRENATRPDFLVKASQWMTVSRGPLEASLAEANAGSARTEYLRTLLIPDELFFQSLIHAYTSQVSGLPTTATPFEADASSPEWLSVELILRMRAESTAPFARKMPPDASRELVEFADRLSDGDASPTDRAATAQAPRNVERRSRRPRTPNAEKA